MLIGVKEWRRKDTVDKTWEYFKTFFARYFREIRVQPRTSASEVYGKKTSMREGHANAAEFEMQQQQAEALANLATVTAADRQAVAELSISNATLTHELRTEIAMTATLQQSLASCACAPTPQTGTKVQQRRPANQQRQHNPSRDFTPLDPDGYCWSHGYHVLRDKIEHRATIPFQDIRVQPPERIRWEEAQSTSGSDIVSCCSGTRYCL